MDEPLGTLDAEFRELMCVELRKLHERLRTTTVFVTHDQNEAMALADHIVVMNQGEILQADAPGAIYNFPQLHVRGPLHRPPADELPADRGRGAAPATARCRWPARWCRCRASRPARPPPCSACGPSTCASARRRQGLAAEVLHVEYFGSHWVAELATAAGTLKMLVDKSQRPRARRPASRVGFHAERIVLFDAASEQLLASATTRQQRLEAARHGQH